MVINTPKKWPLVIRQTARDCYGQLTYLTDDGTEICRLPIKWDALEPIKYEIHPEGKIETLLEPSLIRATRFIDIPPDREEPLAFAVRVYGRPNAHGWTAENYMYPQWANLDCVLPAGKYRVRISLRTGGEEFKEDFDFTNGDTLGDFELIDVAGTEIGG